jgi:hypothetical protein
MQGFLKDILPALIYFFLSTVITWWFIAVSPLYISEDQMLLSCGIAGGKWMVQLIAGFILLHEKRWEFIRRIGFTCFIGSFILLPYCLSSVMKFNDSSEFFLASLIFSVVTMILIYYRSVKKCRISLLWWIAWLLCLAIAVSLQLTVVFHVL